MGAADAWFRQRWQLQLESAKAYLLWAEGEQRKADGKVKAAEKEVERLRLLLARDGR